MKTKLHISVRSLVDYVFRSGDLGSGTFSTIKPVDAIRAHQKIQKSRPEEYTGEVPVSYTFETDKYILTIGGRIDGVFRYPDKTVIEEIKTTTRDIEQFGSEDNPLHWGQAKCYAYMYAANENLDKIEVVLTYFNIVSSEIFDIRREYSFHGLEEFFRNVVHSYLDWAGKIVEWRRVRDESVRGMEFPFETYRPGQRDMAAEVYRTIKKQTQLIVQAPTGIGKTMAAVFPALKALTEKLSTKIFYLTARTTGRTAAENSLSILRGRGLKIKSVSLTAKEKICLNTECTCTPEDCEYAKGHFDRTNEALNETFKYESFTREDIEALSEKYKLCPFEFSLELAMWADCVICDYNYALDPRIYLKRFFTEDRGEYTFLIDEAHNLVDRSREMFSAELVKRQFMDLRKSMNKKVPAIHKALARINTWMNKAGKQCEAEANPRAEKDQPEDFYPLLRKFILETERWLVQNIKTPFRKELLDIYFEAGAFLRIVEYYDENYAAIFEKINKDFRLKLFCINPASLMKEAMERCDSAVFFSATMIPVEYFRKIFGCDESVGALLLASPFPQENLRVLIADRISTLYKKRDKTKEEVAGAVCSMVNHRKGNYLLYFPSYEYLLKIFDIASGNFRGAQVIVQERGMTEAQRDDFLERFDKDNDVSLVGFAVLGGIFGEGIDLVGDRLTGAAIIGVGLPGLSIEREMIKEYFAYHYGAGFEFAFMYPGINKVFQAAGRVIRSETDMGVVLLIDQRFREQRYKSLFPTEWAPVRVTDLSEIERELDNFREKSQ